MAQGDVSEGSPIWTPGGDQLVAEMTSGPRAGARWRLRTDQFAAPSPKGASKYRGQTGRAAAILYWTGVVGPVRITEEGLDRAGRLVGRIEHTARLLTLRDFVGGATSTVSMTRTTGPGVVVFTYDPTWPLLADEGRIEVDPALP